MNDPDQPRHDSGPELWDWNDDALFSKTWLEGMTMAEMGKLYDRSTTSIHKRAARLGLPSRRGPRPKTPAEDQISDAQRRQVILAAVQSIMAAIEDLTESEAARAMHIANQLLGEVD